MKIKIVLGLMPLLMPVSVMGQMKWSQQFQQYFDQYKDMAVDQMRRYHIPASITLAQGVLESGAGGSELAGKGNNHLVSNVMDGQDVPSIMTMTRITSASVPIPMPQRVMRIIPSSCLPVVGTVPCSN